MACLYITKVTGEKSFVFSSFVMNKKYLSICKMQLVRPCRVYLLVQSFLRKPWCPDVSASSMVALIPRLLKNK